MRAQRLTDKPQRPVHILPKRMCTGALRLLRICMEGVCSHKIVERHRPFMVCVLVCVLEFVSGYESMCGWL